MRSGERSSSESCLKYASSRFLLDNLQVIGKLRAFPMFRPRHWHKEKGQIEVLRVHGIASGRGCPERL
jgi:hypothetical protein